MPRSVSALGMVRCYGAGRMVARPPYSRLAACYDRFLGLPSLARSRATLEALVRRYGIKFGSAADLGCGTGLFALYLRRRWRVPVFAVDRSPAMLRQAVRNGSSRHVALLCQDIRALDLPHPVDLITANFDTLNHLLDPAGMSTAFARIYANLRIGGHFIFDLVTDRLSWPPGRTIVRRLADAECDMSQYLVWHPWCRLISIALVQRDRGTAGVIEHHVERAYPPLDVLCRLRRAGFRICAVLDAGTLNQAHPNTVRIIVVARKIGMPDAPIPVAA